MRARRVGLVLLAWGLLSPSGSAGLVVGDASGGESTSHGERMESGTVVRGTYAGAEGSRPWRLFVPERMRGAASPMLLVALHGCTQNANDFAAGTQLDAVAESEGFLVLYPEQVASANARLCWNWYDVGHQDRGHGEPAIIAAMTQEVAREYGANVASVHLLGLSAGAAMATLTVVAFPELFATLVAASGVPWKAAPNVGRALVVMQKGAEQQLPGPEAMVSAMADRARAVPVLLVHGGKDAVVNVRNSEESAAQWVGVHDRLRSGASQPALVPDGEVSVRQENGYTIDERSWRDTARVAQVTLLRIEELGHAWSGGSPAGSFVDPKGPDISRRVARFCAAHPMFGSR